LDQIETPRAFGVAEVAGTFVLFLGTCLAKKVFDEFYDRLLKRPLAPFLDRLCRSEHLPKESAVTIRDVVHLEDIDLVVVIEATTTADSSVETARLVLQAHRVAHSYIEAHGRKAPVHLHRVHEGKVSLEPELFISLEQRSAVQRRAQLPRV
jgi:hypothetical protein